MRLFWVATGAAGQFTTSANVNSTPTPDGLVCSSQPIRNRCRQRFVVEQFGQHWRDRPRRQDPLVLARLENLFQAADRAGGIQRHIDAVRLVDSQQADDGRRRARHQQRHPIEALATRLFEQPRDLSGERVEFGVGQRRVARHHGRRCRPLPCLLRHPVLQESRHGNAGCCARSNAANVWVSSSKLGRNVENHRAIARGEIPAELVGDLRVTANEIRTHRLVVVERHQPVRALPAFRPPPTTACATPNRTPSSPGSSSAGLCDLRGSVPAQPARLPPRLPGQ